MANFIFGDNRLEKVGGEFKRLTVGLQLSCTNGVAPTLAAVSPPPLSAALVDIVTANGAGILVPGITFASLLATGNNPVLGLEIADGLVTSTAVVLGAFGTVTNVSNATTNIQSGAPIFWTGASYASAGVGIGLNIQFGLVATITGMQTTLSGATASTVNCLITVLYADR